LVCLITHGCAGTGTSASSRPFMLVLGDNNGRMIQTTQSNPQVKAKTVAKPLITGKVKREYAAKDRKALDKLVVASDKP